MLSDEEKEIFKNLKEYMQNNINNGYHKFVYNDLDWDFKCIDCINAIDKVLKQSKEIEDNKKKSIVIIEYQDLYEKLQDKIKAKIDYLLKQYDSENFINFEMFIKILQSLLKEE